MSLNHHPDNPPSRYWAVVVAAGSGRRMSAEIPKQYLPLHGKTVMEHSLRHFIEHPGIAGIVIALAENDQRWGGLALQCAKPLVTVGGGAERCHSVLNAVERLGEWAVPPDWVLVHDAARPCLRRADIDSLMTGLRDHAVGGLLAAPVRDTMKRSDAQGNVRETVCREHLWHALTPQMFRFAALRDALRNAITRGLTITDEASAIEAAGMSPRLVPGHADNIKITQGDDLALAEFYLRRQAEE